jgi:signal recognition particle GTPase
MLQRDFKFSDFLSQMTAPTRLGPIGSFLMARLGLPDPDPQEFEAQLRRLHAIASAMTNWERDHPEQLNANRRRRIASGAGVEIMEVSQLIRQFEMSRQMMRQVSSGGWPIRRGAVLGLVGDDPINRDPSYVSPLPQRDVWPTALAIAIALTAIIIFFSYMAVQ